MLFDLSGRVVPVAGGAGYLGQPICRALAEQGATVIVADLAQERADASPRLIMVAGDQVPIEAPFRRIATLPELVEKYGRY